jgi:hypothetical protein
MEDGREYSITNPGLPMMLLYSVVSHNMCVGPTLVNIFVRRQWFSPGTQVSCTNNTDHHDITEILLKVALNTITLTF